MPRNDSFDRRSVLKTIGGAAAGGMALAATGTASAERAELEQEYADSTSLREAFREHAADLPAALAEAGVVTGEFGFGDLDVEIEESATRVQPTDADGRAGVTVVQANGPRTALGMISTSTDAHEVTLYVQPQRERSYAIVEPTEDGDDFVVHDDGEVEPLQCLYEECTCEYCYHPDGFGYNVLEQYRCNINCNDCVVEGTSCECTNPC